MPTDPQTTTQRKAEARKHLDDCVVEVAEAEVFVFSGVAKDPDHPPDMDDAYAEVASAIDAYRTQ